jgi:heat shock protein HtpX
MYSSIAANKRNTAIVMMMFLVVIGGLGLLISYSVNEGWSLALMIFVVAAVYVGVEYFAAGKLALAMNGAKEINKRDYPELWNVVENITIAEGLPMPKVYVIDDPAPNAFATGRSPKHAAVAATTGLLSIMDKRELTAVMAHEMGHVKNYDILVATIAFGLASAISVICDMVWRTIVYSDRDDDKNGAIIYVIGLVAVILAPIVAMMIRLAISRQREYLADASSALTTRDSEGMIMALEKLSNNVRPMERQNTSTAHLFIVNPLKPKGLMNKLFSTHPPIEERIARLRKNSEKM